MSSQKPGSGSDQHIDAIYTELCNSYRAIDQFRGVLLGALPLASGTGLFLLVKESPGIHDQSLVMALGFFGFLITLGLFIFEIYGIRRCTHLIVLGKYLEKERLHAAGQFICRPVGVKGFGSIPKSISPLVSEPLAAGVIYPAVLGAWIFLAFKSQEPWGLPLGMVFGVIVFAVGCAGMFKFNRWLKEDSCVLWQGLKDEGWARDGAFIDGL